MCLPRPPPHGPSPPHSSAPCSRAHPMGPPSSGNKRQREPLPPAQMQPPLWLIPLCSGEAKTGAHSQPADRPQPRGQRHTQNVAHRPALPRPLSWDVWAQEVLPQGHRSAVQSHPCLGTMRGGPWPEANSFALLPNLLPSPVGSPGTVSGLSAPSPRPSPGLTVEGPLFHGGQ